MISRLKMAKKVSKIGTPRTSTGIATASSVALLTVPSTKRLASVKPRNSEPQSPMKLLAG